MKKIVTSLIFVLSLVSIPAVADVLPPLENIAIEGNLLVWDAQEGATGYNIYKDYRYYTTVPNSEPYSLSDSGVYFVVSFDDAGNFGQTASRDYLDYEVVGSDATQYSFHGYTLIAQKTCQNVGPGESCVASCPNRYDAGYATVYSQYVSGGACSTSDIVEADSIASSFTYSCTVPTFSGEVVAQAICVVRRE